MIFYIKEKPKLKKKSNSMEQHLGSNLLSAQGIKIHNVLPYQVI